MKNVHEIEIELVGKEWEDILDKAFKKRAKEVKVDGFRKGFVPKDMYLKKFGIESLYTTAIDDALAIAYRKAMSDSKLIPAIEPKIDVKHICADCVTFLFTIVTKPEIKLGEYKNLKVKRAKVEVTKEELDKEIEALRSRFAEIVVKEKGKLENGNTAIIDFEGFVDGKALEGGTGTNYPLEIGSNSFIPGFEEKIIGMNIGEKKEINLKFPEDYVEDLKGKEVVFKVTLNGIKERIMPELNKDFYEDLGMKDVKDEKSLRDSVEKNIKAKKEADEENNYIEALLEKASSNMKVEINEEIIDDAVMRMIKQYEEQLKMQGLTLEQYFEFTKGNLEDLKKSMRPEALKRVKYRYLLEEIATKEKYTFTDKEIKEEASKMAKNYGMSDEDFIKEFGGLETVKYDMEMREAISTLKGEEK